MSATLAIPTPTTNSAHWWMVLLQAVAASLGLALVAAIVFELQDVHDAGITQLEFEGAFQHVKPEFLREQLAPLFAPGATPRMEDLKTRLERQPWVAHARVERTWPAGVRVRIWEYLPYACWNDALLAADGTVFRVPAEEIPPGLPQLAGPEGRAAEVRAAFDGLAASLAGTAFAPTALALDERGDWVAQTAGGIALRFGRSDLAEQAAFVKTTVSAALAQRLGEVEYVDLHYGNGFAVGFRAPQKTSREKKQ